MSKQAQTKDSWKDPSRFFFYGGNKGGDNDSVASSSVHDESVLSHLDGSKITDSSSLMYSETSMQSIILSQEVLRDLGSLDSGNDDASSIISNDHYFDYQSPDEGEPYIFTDEQESPFPSGNDEDSSSSLSSSTSCSSSQFNNNNNSKLMFQLPRELQTNALEDSAAAWSYYNKQRGRLLAQHLLHKIRQRQQEEKLDDADDEASMDSSVLNLGLSVNKREQQRQGYPRVSTSIRAPGDVVAAPPVRVVAAPPVDLKVETDEPDTLKKPRASMLGRAVQTLRRSRKATKASPSLSLSSMRNRNVDFESWERSVMNKQKSKKKTTTNVIQGILSNRKNRRHNKSDRRVPSTVSRENSGEPKTDPVIKAVSLGTSVQWKKKRPTTVNTTALDARASSDDIAAQLGLGDTASRLLKRLRATAGVFDEEEQTSSSEVPLLHILEGLWIPHYEEYVFSTVHNFGCRLCAAT